MNMIHRWVRFAAPGMIGLWLMAGLPPTGLAQEDESDTIEIVIEHSAFHMETTKLRVDEEAVLVIRNLDPIQHGFTSPAFRGVDVRVETEEAVTYGKGIQGVYIEPGQEVSITFTPKRSGKLTFRCDLHPGMKGEVIYLTINAT